MKVIIYFLLFLLSCDNSNTEPTSTWQLYGTSTDNELTDISFINENDGIATGAFGTVIKTQNAGKTWQALKVGITHSFLSTFILSKSEFYVSRIGIYRTQDGGNTFQELSNLSQVPTSIFGIHFFDSKTGIIQKGHQVLRTVDSGENWDVVYSLAEFPRRLQFVNDTVGFLTGGISYDGLTIGEMHKTIDAGKSWNKVDLQTADITSASFLNEDIGYYSTILKELYKTIDGGQSWVLVNNEISKTEYATHLLCIKNNELYAILGHDIYFSSDSGKTFSLELSENNNGVFTGLTQNPNHNIYAITNMGKVYIKK